MDTEYLLYKIYRLLEDDSYKVKMSVVKGYFGYTNLVDEIVINPKGEFWPTVIHECLHMIYFQKTEREITKIEKFMCRTMTDRQWTNLANRFLAKLINKKRKGK